MGEKVYNTTKLEVELTNLAAKPGKGEVVDALSFSVGHGANTLRKVASVRMFHQAHKSQNHVSYPLKRKAQHDDLDEVQDSGCLLVSTTCFERRTTANYRRDMGDESVLDRDIGFWIGLWPQGSWESIRLLLPLSIFPKPLQNDFITLEVVTKDGKKHAIFRSLATLVNELELKLDISIFSMYAYLWYLIMFATVVLYNYACST